LEESGEELLFEGGAAGVFADGLGGGVKELLECLELPGSGVGAGAGALGIGWVYGCGCGCGGVRELEIFCGGEEEVESGFGGGAGLEL
jgi:hypothetical protein